MNVESPSYWLEKIAEYDREFETWDGRVRKILKRYRDDQKRNEHGSRFAILWSNVQTLSAALFARLPQPEVARRHGDRDAVGRVASQVLERALEFELEHYTDYSASLRAAIYDRLLGGRGVAWARYEPRFRALSEASGAPPDGEQASEDVSEPVEALEFETAPVDYVHWADFGHSVARSWEEVQAVWRKVYMTEGQLVERFGEEVARQVPMDARPQGADDRMTKSPDDMGCVFEIWHKPTQQVFWLAKGVAQFLDVQPDPLGLDGFFPCPRPLYATITNDDMVPVPDYALYQDQAHTLDVLADRVEGLIKALRVRGVYDAAEPALARLFTEGENGALLPVKNWAAFAEKGGMAGSIALVDIAPIAKALSDSYAAAENVKAQIYEITGISDIVRGQTAAAETATAQQIKSQYASLRLRAMQDEVTRFATDLLTLKAQIICRRFAPQTILQMAAADQMPAEDQQLLGPAMELLLGERMMDPESEAPNVLRAFRIRISSDSMVYMDEQAEKEQRVEFLTAASAYIERAVQGAQIAPALTPLFMELFRFGIGAFKAAEPLEASIDAVLDQQQQQVPPEVLQQVQQQAMQQAMEQAQAAVAQEMQKAQSAQQSAQAEQQQVERAKMQLELLAARAQAQQSIQALSTERDYLRVRDSVSRDAIKAQQQMLDLRSAEADAEQRAAEQSRAQADVQVQTAEQAAMMVRELSERFAQFATAMAEENVQRSERSNAVMQYLAENGSPRVRELIGQLGQG